MLVVGTQPGATTPGTHGPPGVAVGVGVLQGNPVAVKQPDGVGDAVGDGVGLGLGQFAGNATGAPPSTLSIFTTSVFPGSQGLVFVQGVVAM